jgi:hypothetical protein
MLQIYHVAQKETVVQINGPKDWMKLRTKSVFFVHKLIFYTTLYEFHTHSFIH